MEEDGEPWKLNPGSWTLEAAWSSRLKGHDETV